MMRPPIKTCACALALLAAGSVASPAAMAQAADGLESPLSDQGAGYQATISDATRCDAALRTLSVARQEGGESYRFLLQMFSSAAVAYPVMGSDGPLPASVSYLTTRMIRICQQNGGWPLSQAAKTARDDMDQAIGAALAAAEQ